MNKAELVSAIASRSGQTKTQAEAGLNAALAIIQERVVAGDKVTLVGFGTFEQRTRKARTGRNPKTGEKIEIPAAKVPTFSAGKTFKEMVNHAS